MPIIKARQAKPWNNDELGMIQLTRTLWWAKQSIQHKAIWLIALALILAAVGEGVCNLRAMTTWYCEPETLSLADFYERDGTNAEITEEGILISAQSGDPVIISNEAVYTPLKTVAVTLSGVGAVQVDFLITDDASQFYEQQVFSTVGVADDPQLRFAYGYVASAGDANTLTLRLTGLDCDVFTVSSVEINAPIPFTFSWYAMSATT